MRLFPSTHYTRLIRAYFTYSEIPLKEDDESDTEDNEPTTTAEAEQTDPIEEIIVCLFVSVCLGRDVDLYVMLLYRHSRLLGCFLGLSLHIEYSPKYTFMKKTTRTPSRLRRRV